MIAPMHPLTHHEIIALVEPFARAGRHVDLAASDRATRRLAFRRIEHPADGPSLPARREDVTLVDAVPGRRRLVRTLTTADGAQATLQVDGTDLAALLERMASIAHDRQLRRVGADVIALDHRIEGARAAALTRGNVRVADLHVELTVPPSGRGRAELVLTTGVDDPLELPDDLLAVLGRDWSRLDAWTDRSERRWRGGVRLRGRGDAAGADAERKLERIAAHIATTLAETPARFHERHRAARWVFAYRRAIPLLFSVALIGATLGLARMGIESDSVIRMLMFNAPPLLLAGFFCLREIPRFELPRWPRASKAAAWRDRTPATAPLDLSRRIEGA